MPRRNTSFKKDILPDPIYKSTVVAKLINQVMQDGKKSVAQRIVYRAFDIASEKIGEDQITVFSKALENIMPVLETKSRRVGGANYQVPVEVRAERRQTLGIRFLVLFAQKRSERGMDLKLAGEIIDAYNNAGGAVKKKEDMHRMAEANKAFAHFRY